MKIGISLFKEPIYLLIVFFFTSSLLSSAQTNLDSSIVSYTNLANSIATNKDKAKEEIKNYRMPSSRFSDSSIEKNLIALLNEIDDNYSKNFTKGIAEKWLINSFDYSHNYTAKSIVEFLANLEFESLHYDSALYYINIGDSLLNLYEDYDKWGELFLLKAAIYDSNGDYLMSIKSVFEAIDKFEQGDINKKELAFSYLQLGSSYLYINFLDKAESYYRLAENYFNDLDDTLGAAITRSKMALVEIERKNYTKAIALLKGSLDEIIASERHSTISYALQSISEVFLELNEVDSAAFYLDKSSKLNKELGYPYGIGLDYYLKSKVLSQRSENDSAIYYGLKAYQLLEKESEYDILNKLTIQLANQFKSQGNLSKSILFFEKNNEVNSALREESKNINKLIQIENANLEKAKYELKLLKEKKKIQEYDNERKQERFKRAAIVAAISIVLLIMALYILYRNRVLNKQLKAQKDLLSRELEIKRSLLSEIHHRVKNNLQIISSMLSIQSQYIKDERFDKIIRECRNRIVSMSLIHESLYKRENDEKSIFSQYIKELIPQLIDTYQIDENNVNLILEVDEFELSLDDSVTCELLINEIISNSLKHAFIGIQKGEILLRMTKNSSHIELHISDNGVGLDKEIIPEEHDSFGFLLINSLIKQLGAKMTIKNVAGLEFTIRWRFHSDKLLS